MTKSNPENVGQFDRTYFGVSQKNYKTNKKVHFKIFS
jgi:hypothetical protein